MPASAQRFQLMKELIRIAVRQDHEAQRFGQLRSNLAEKVRGMPAKLDADSVSAVVGQPCEGFSGYLRILGVFEIQHPGLTRPACSNRQGGVDQPRRAKNDHLRTRSAHLHSGLLQPHVNG